MTGVQLIEQERKRQIEQEGYRADHDDNHTEHELRHAAIAYILSAAEDDRAYHFWPFDGNIKPGDSAIDDLVKAGALIAAEIDRITREM